VSRGFWLASWLGFPLLNTTLVYTVGRLWQAGSLPWLPLIGVLLAEVALLGTRLHGRSRAAVASTLILATLAISAFTVVGIFAGFVPYALIVCGTSATPCFG
jgi:hypothetical protein